MQDFSDYIKNGKTRDAGADLGVDKNLMNLVSSLAGKFDGKSQNELIKAIYDEAKKGKQNGTLTNKEIDNFAKVLSPMLDDKKRKTLFKIVEELKQI